MKNRNWRKYAFEFVSIFIAVVSAFALNNWNENRKNSQAESKILDEIVHGLEKDIKDVQLNVLGHRFGLKSSQFWRNIITDEPANLDTIQDYYFNFLRDFISIQNTSGYETLKSRGLELIKNDSLRTAIIGLYEYNYKTLKILEEEYAEMQFHATYFKEINDFIAPHFQYDEKGKILGIKRPLNLSQKDQNRLLSYLWKIDRNRRFILDYYAQIEKNINALKEQIEEEQQQLTPFWSSR